MSFSKNSRNGFLINRVQNSYFDSKELSLLNDVETAPAYGGFSDVLPEEKTNLKPFIIEDWDNPDVDLQNDRMMLDLSNPSVKESDFIPKNPNRKFSSGKKTSVVQKNNDLMQNKTPMSASTHQESRKSLNTEFDSTENELVNAFSHLKIESNILSDATSGNVSKLNLKNWHSIKDLSVPKHANHVPEKLYFDRPCPKTFHDSKRLSTHPKEKTFLAYNKDRYRLSLAPSNGSFLPEEGLEEDSSYKIKGVLVLKQNFSSTGDSYEKVHNSHGTREYAAKPSCREERLRQTLSKRSRRFPVDRSSLLRSVLTKSVLIVS